jgi:hypothetical protein
MADMKVAMTLTLRDLATVKLQKFSDVLKSLQDQIAPLNDQLKLMADQVSALGGALDRAVAPLRSLGRSFKVNADAAAAFGDSVNLAAGAAERMGTASGAAAAGMDGLGASAEAADAKMGKLHGTMKGMAELFGAWEIGEGLKKAVDVAAEYQNRMVQLRNLNIAPKERKNILQDARQWAKIPGVSKLDALEAANAAVAGAPGAGKYQQAVREGIMPSILKAAVALKTTYGDPNSVHDIVRNLLGIVEMRGKLQNLAQAKKAVETAFKVMVGSDGKISFKDMETGYRNTGYGEAINLSTKGVILDEAMHEQFKASGKGGGAGGNTKASTITTMVAAMVMGGKMQKAQAMMLEQLGLLKPADVRKIPGSSQVFVNPDSILNSNTALRNPFEWLRHTFDPHLRALAQKQHADYSPAEFKNYVLDWAAAYAKSSGGVNVGTGIVTTVDNKQWESVKQRAKMMTHAASIEQATANATQSLAMKMRHLHAVMETIGVQIGTSLLPALEGLAHLATIAAGALQSLNSHFPIFKTIEAWAAALGGILLGIKGVKWLLGVKDGFEAIKAVDLGKSMLSVSTRALGLSGNLAMASAKMLGAAGAAGALGYGIGTLMNDLINASGRAITGNKNWSLGGQVYQWTHTSAGHFAALRHGANVPIGVRNNNPGDLMVPGTNTLQRFPNAATGLAHMAMLLKGPAYFGGGLQTVAQIVSKYAPPKNAAGQVINNTAGYIRGVSSMMRVAPNAKLNLNDPATLDHLMAGMLAQEGTLKYYSPAEIASVARVIAQGKSAPLQNKALDRLRANQAALVGKVNPADLGYVGPTTAQGIAKAKALAQKHATELAKQHEEATNKLRAAFRKRIDAAIRFQNHLQAIAGSIHAAYQGIFNPLSSKIPAVQRKYSAISGELLANGHARAAKEALAVGQHQVYKLQYEGAMRRLHALQGALHMGITSNAALVTAGSMTKMQAGQADIALQKSMAPQMVKAAQAALQYAKALKDPALVQSLTDQVAKLKAMGKELGYYSSKVKDSFQNGLTGFFENLMHGQKTWGQMFEQLFAGIGRSIENTLAKSISQSITDSLMGKKANQGIGSIIGGISHWIGSLFGGSGSSGATAAHGGGLFSDITAGGSFLSDLFSVFGSFAVGADNIPNDMVAQIHKGEMIIPAGPAEAIRSGAVGGNQLHLTIHAMDSQSVLSALHSVRQEAAALFLNTAAHENLGGYA